MLVDLQSKHLLPLRWKRTPVMMHKFNWNEIASWIIDNQLLVWDEFDGDVVDHTIEEWKQLTRELCGPESHDDEPTKAREVEASTSETPFKSFVDTKLTHFSAKDRVCDDPQAQLCSNCVRRDGSRVKLNDTNNEVRPRVMAFESDTLSIKEQEDNIKSPVWSAKVFSGNKSLHVLVEIPDSISKKLDAIDDVDKVAVYHHLYRDVAERLFKDTSHLDMACKSWLRKFRTPDGIRDNGNKQTATYNSSVDSLPWDSMLQWCVEVRRADEKNQHDLLANRLAGKKRHDASGSAKVRYFLDTTFPKMTGNGDSDKSLYAALCACEAVGDQATLEEVICKARAEKWSTREIERKLADVRRFLSRSGSSCI